MNNLTTRRFLFTGRKRRSNFMDNTAGAGLITWRVKTVFNIVFCTYVLGFISAIALVVYMSSPH